MHRHYPPVGVFRQGDGSHTFRVWAPGKKSMELVILAAGNPSYQELQHDGYGYWTAIVQNVNYGTRYRYRVDGENEFADPASLSQPEGVHGPSEVIDLQFTWHDEDWRGVSRGDMIMYEVHTGTFSNEGNFEGIIKRLDHLKQLGINAIELMPIAQFPGSRNWGYDGAFPFAVQNTYGGAIQLKKLVNAAHLAGIAIILDVVYNHTGPEGSCFHAYGPYFIEKYKSPWGPVVNLDDEWSFGVRSYFIQNALLWLDEFHIDGLRMDAVHAMFDNSALHFMEELKLGVKEIEQRTGKRKILIAELDLNNPRYINAPGKGGFGLDAQWVDEFHHALHAVLTGETSGYYSDFGDIKHLHKAFRDTYVYTGEYSQHRRRNFGVPVNNDFDQFVVFSQNHDHTGNRMLGERLSALISFDGLKMAAAATILSPYIPLLFMGEEYGEKNPFLYFISHEDEELVAAVRKGRKEEFSYFNWEADPPDPFARETFQKSFPCWNCEENQEATLLSFYRKLIALRKELPAFRATSRESLLLHPLQHNTIAYDRYHASGNVLVVMNFGKEIDEFTLPLSTGRKILDSSAIEWSGSGECSMKEYPGKKVLVLNPLTVTVFEK